MVEFEIALARCRAQTQERLVRKHPKSRFWLPALRFSGIFLGSRTRGKMFEADYLWMRTVDDMADGDIPVPKPFNSVSQYIESKLTFLESPNTPGDDVDTLVLNCERLSAEAGLSLKNERRLILQSMLFDARRFGKYQIFPASVLEDHFYRRDIEGSTKGTLKLFREDPEKWIYMYPLVVASRIYDNLHDYEEDITAGFINIPVEDIEHFRITLEDIYDVNSPRIQVWFAAEKKRGKDLLRQDRELFPEGRFRPIGKLFVERCLRRPASKFLRRTAAEPGFEPE